jgi:glutathione S-transferase
MRLILHYHPLASYCWKVLIALYENGTPFTAVLVDHGDPASRAAFADIWPVAKMPVLQDGERAIPETSIILEYLNLHHKGERPLLPEDPEEALQTRLADRFYDLYVQTPMQKIVGDRIRPAGANDPHGVQEARALLKLACGMVDKDMAARQWATGRSFGMADCAAAPALFYANEVMPLGEDFPHALAYLERLKARPSMQRVLKEAEPYFHMFPRQD